MRLSLNTNELILGSYSVDSGTSYTKTDFASISVNEFYSFQLIFEGSNIKVLLADQLLLENHYSDNLLIDGQFGILNSTNTQIQNLQIN